MARRSIPSILLRIPFWRIGYDDERGTNVDDFLSGALPCCAHLVRYQKRVDMLCPKCNKPDLLLIAEEVDIGVGVLRHTRGAECSDCGQLTCCPICGNWSWDGKENHHDWCEDFKKEWA